MALPNISHAKRAAYTPTPRNSMARISALLPTATAHYIDNALYDAAPTIRLDITPLFSEILTHSPQHFHSLASLDAPHTELRNISRLLARVIGHRLYEQLPEFRNDLTCYPHVYFDIDPKDSSQFHMYMEWIYPNFHDAEMLLDIVQKNTQPIGISARKLMHEQLKSSPQIAHHH